MACMRRTVRDSNHWCSPKLVVRAIEGAVLGGLLVTIILVSCQRSRVTARPEIATRIEVSGESTRLFLRTGYCSESGPVHGVQFLSIKRLRADGASEEVCRLERLDPKGPELPESWIYDATPRNYRRSGCATLTPSNYVIGVGIVVDAIAAFEIRPDGSVAQKGDPCGPAAR